jgi:NAD(P)-dependent dehydrogenase (short-subunit alcohol dehydrogenase family)
MAGKLAGRVAIVTGGAEGIGRATAELFIEQGAQVIVGDIQDELGRELELKYPGRAHFVHADVSQEADIESLVSAAITQFGALHVMVNNAASAGDGSSMLELSAEGFERTLRLVAASVMSGHASAARQFRRQGTGGSIVSTASVAGLQGAWGAAAYTAAKHAVVGIVRAAAVELAPLGIRSNAVAPGSIVTPGSMRVLGIPEDRVDEFLTFLEARTGGLQPLGREGRASDVAQAILFLASDDAGWITGVTLPVDGGATAIALGGLAPKTIAGTESPIIKAVADFLHPVSPGDIPGSP